MKLEPATRAELERLLSIYCDDEPNDAERDRLNELLRDDAECRRFYWQYLDLHARLLQMPGTTPPLALQKSHAGLSCSLPLNSSSPPAGSVIKSYLWLLLAAVVLLPAVRMVWLGSQVEQGTTSNVTSNAPTTPAALPMRPSLPKYAAVIAEAEGAVWADRAVREVGSRLRAEAFKLESGRVTLRFEGGAQMTLFAPAQVRLISTRSAALCNGRSLVCDDGAVGSFELLTPQARLVDDGAQYAVIVAPEAEEVHIISGEVWRTSRPHWRLEVPSVRLTEGKARRFARPGATPGILVALDSRWSDAVRLQRPQTEKADPEFNLIAYESFEPDSPNFWKGEWVLEELGSRTGEFRRTFGLRHASMPHAAGDAKLLRGRVAVSRLLPAPLRTDCDGAYYFSFLVRNSRATEAGTPCDIQFAFRDRRSNDPQQKLSTTISWAKNSVAVGWEGGGRQTSVPLDLLRVYAVVGKIVTGGNTPDQVFVRLYGGNQSLPSNEPIDWTVSSFPVNSRIEFDSVQWSSANVHGIAVDELRLGSTWDAVAEPYELPIVVAAKLGKQLPPQTE